MFTVFYSPCLSENGVALNPPVNDHCPLRMTIFWDIITPFSDTPTFLGCVVENWENNGEKQCLLGLILVFILSLSLSAIHPINGNSKILN